jgi:hypothetical protein
MDAGMKNGGAVASMIGMKKRSDFISNLFFLNPPN